MHAKVTKDNNPLDKKTDVWKIVSGALFVLLIISIYTNGFMASDSTEAADIKAVTEEATDFINTFILQGQATATLGDVAEESGLYKFSIDINGNSFDSYVTKDGKLLFPQAYDLTNKPEKPAAKQQPATPEFPKTDTPDVKMFVMSYCPFGQQAEKGLQPVAEALAGVVEVEPRFVIYSNYGGGGPNYCIDEENKYCSMHGIKELKEDVRQLCIWKYDKDNFWAYVKKLNAECSLGNVDKCWEGVADAIGIDTGKIKACEEEEAIELLAEEVELMKKYGVSGSPTVIINDQKYNGPRTPEAYKSAICSAFNEAPEGCGTELSSETTAASGSC